MTSFEGHGVRVDASETLIVIGNASASIALDAASGEITCASSAMPFVLHSRAAVLSTAGRIVGEAPVIHHEITGSDLLPDGVAIVCRQAATGGSTLHSRFHANASCFAIELGVSETNASLNRISPFDARLPLEGGKWKMLRLAYCGAHSRSPLSTSSLVTVDSASAERSWWCSALTDGGSHGVLIGFLAAKHFVGTIEVANGNCHAYNYAESCRAAGSTVWSEPLLLSFGGDVVRQLLGYADLVGRLAGTSVKAPVFGWSSWLRYGAEFDASTVEANAAVLQQWFGGLAARPLVQIDHGWERRLRLHRPERSWQPRPGFGDIGRLISSVRLRGLDAGLWVVPFAVNVAGDETENDLEYVVRDSRGEPKLVGARENYCIDPTHPAGERRMREMFRRFRGWGANYFKLEYLRILLSADPLSADDGLDDARVYARARTRAEAYRHGLAIIRDEVGPDCYLLACGAPALPGAGLVDAHRVGGDIGAGWHLDDETGIEPCARNAAANFFWNGRVWQNDPDVLATFREENLLRFWTTTVAFTGGPALVSTDLTTTPESAARAMLQVMPPLGIAAVPLRVTTDDGVEQWLLPLACGEERYFVIGLFNAGEEQRETQIDASLLPWTSAAETHVCWDFWQQRPADVTAGTIRRTIGGRDAAVICVRQAKQHPQLTGSTLHISMGAAEVAECEWNSAARVLRIELTSLRRSGTLAIRVPSPFALKEVSDGDVRVEDGYVYLDLHTQIAREIRMRFDR